MENNIGLQSFTNDDAFIEKIKAGDRNAQYRLYQDYSKAMYNICKRMMQQSEEAEDVLQESFLDVFSKIHNFRNESSIGAWIKRIVINKCLNKLNRKNILMYEIGEKEESISDEDDGEEAMWDMITVNQVKNAAALLPEGYRVIFNLYAFENYGHKEIAESLKISESTSKTQYKRAKEKLKKMLTENIQLN